eukprot:3756052-Pyramimonas_sp.AAC.1
MGRAGATCWSTGASCPAWWDSGLAGSTQSFATARAAASRLPCRRVFLGGRWVPPVRHGSSSDKGGAE